MKNAGIIVPALIILTGALFFLGRPSVVSTTAVPSAPITPKSGGELLAISAGEFTMGRASGRLDETPHSVAVAAFLLDKTPITQDVFERVMGTAANHSKHKGKQYPVEQITWFNAIHFCNQCSEIDGLAPCYDPKTGACNFEASGYRLPTEAEWEYACRAGTKTRFSSGDDDAALIQSGWCKLNSGGATHPVAQKRPNAWGLFDMHGNVWQWCNDFYAEDYYAKSPHETPRGPSDGKRRVLRGGAWDCPPERCTASYRYNETANFADVCYGGFDCYGIRRARRLPNPGDAAIQANPTATTPTVPPVSTEPSAPQKPMLAPSANPGKFEAAGLRGTLVFASNRSGVLKIWSMRANGKEAKQLTTGDTPDADPRFSPDGKTILYTTLRGGFPEVWAMKRDGSESHAITKGMQAAWSPDGASIVFIRDNQTFVRELESGKEHRVTPDAWQRCGVPAWSPDGKQIAVASRHLDTIGIFLLSVDGSKSEALKTGDASCTPTWSHNGTRLLCQTVQGHVFQLDRDGKNWEQITFGADLQHDARYSPDGTMVIFARAPAVDGPWQISVQKLGDDDGAYITLTTEGSNLQPDWNADE